MQSWKKKIYKMHQEHACLKKKKWSSYFAGHGVRAAGHFLFRLPGFDFGTS